MVTVAANTTGDMLSRVRAKLEKPGDIPPSFGILIYGRSGSGKTSLLRTMPGKGLVIDVRTKENGTNVLRAERERIDVFPLERWNELDDVRNYLLHPDSQYRWVALDSITGLLSLAEEATIPRSASLSAAPRSLKGQEWGQMGGRVIRLLDTLHSMKIYTLITAQEKRREVFDLGNVIVPDVIPMLLTPLTEPLLLIGHLRVEYLNPQQKEWQLRVQSHPTYYSKNRLPPEVSLELPDVIRDPHLGRLIRFIYGKGPAPDAATPKAPPQGVVFEDD